VKRVLIAGLAVVLAIAAVPLPAARKAADPLERLARLYEDGRYFELRDAVAAIKDPSLPELEFFRGAVDELFNRLDPAVSRLRNYLRSTEKSPAHMLIKEAWTLLGDTFRRLGRYREAAGAFQNILDHFGTVLNDDERINFRSQIELWSSLADVPPPRVEIAADTVIRMTKRQIPVLIGGRTFFVGYDTGSNLSILFKSVADELAVARYGPPIKVQTSTGKSIVGRVSVVPEMRLGSILIKNAIFLVLPDELFRSRETWSDMDQRGLLGLPVLEAFKEITETRDGDLIIPASPRPRPEQNMCFSEFLPIVEVRFRGARLSLCLDTGSSATYLYPPFLRRYRGEIKSRSRVRKSTLAGVGNSRSVSVHVLDEFAFKVGGKDLALRKVPVDAQITHADTRVFHGTLGIDILGQCTRMTLNFISMSFILE
jgi:hypothetical protein